MIRITQHRLTAVQVSLIKQALEILDRYGALSPDEARSVDDALEAMNEKIFGGEQEVLIRYVVDGRESGG